MLLGIVRPLALTAALGLLLVPQLARAADTWSTPHPGIRHLYRTTSTPWRIFALEVDLCASGVSLRATQSGERKRTTSSFAKLVGAEAAVNGDFFSYSTYGTSGLAVGKAARWTDTKDNTSEGFVAFGYDRNLLSPPKSVVEPPPGWMREVVSGKPHVLIDGVPMASNPTAFCQTRHPRTAAGFSKDGRKLILAVVDGRTSISVGMKCTELGTLMKNLGAHDALNLDGGGSSTMYVSGKGVVNDPSDGVERIVGNHLAVFATGSGEPGSCDRSFEESAIDGDAYDASTTSDVDGDGSADVCARAGSGIQCSLSSQTAFAAPFAGPALSNASGWDDPANWGTLRMGDLDGDGKADLCARANAGVSCWLSDGKGFSTKIDGPALSDADGWNKPEYYGSLRLADFDGDGRDDLCARSASDFRCYPSTGAGFGPAVTLAAIANAGYGQVEHYGTLRVGDVTGDGKADVCVRGAAGMSCWPSTGTGFGAAITGPAWSDASGWSALQYWSTIRLADVNGDGKADLCARGSAGLACHLSTGTGFGKAVEGPAWSDASGWYRHKFYSTLRLADVDGDGDLDACARAAAGITCAPWTGSGFGAAFAGPALADAQGWGALRFYSTIRFADVNGDRKADVCARSSAGVSCWLSDGKGFPTKLDGPGWSDAGGWDAPEHFSTLRIAGPKCAAVEICGNGLDDDCSGSADDGCGSGTGGAGGVAGAAGSAGGAGGPGWPDGGGIDGSVASGGTSGGGAKSREVAEEDGGCGCRTARERTDWGALAGLAGLLVVTIGRRGRGAWPRGRAS